MKRTIYYRFEQKVKRGEIDKAEMLDPDGNILVFIGGKVERENHRKISKKHKNEHIIQEIKELLAEIDY